jgi:hypothetical protein
MRRLMMMLALVCVAAVAVQAQNPTPIRYRLTRSAAGQAAVATTFLKSVAACNLPVGTPAAGSVRWDDPVNAGRDCERIDAAFFAGMAREVAYSFTLAGQANDIDPWSQESTALVITPLPRIPQIPSATCAVCLLARKASRHSAP